MHNFWSYLIERSCLRSNFIAPIFETFLARPFIEMYGNVTCMYKGYQVIITHVRIRKQEKDCGENTKDSGMRYVIHKVLIITFGLLLITTKMSQV